VMRKMLRTIGPPAASNLLKLSMIAPSLPFHRSIDAPRSRARGRKIEAGKAVHDGERAAVEQRIKALWRVNHKIGDGHFAGEDESRRLGEKTEDQQRAADQLDEAGSADQRKRLQVGKGRYHGPADDLGHAVLDDHQSRDDAKHAQRTRRPRREFFIHDSPPKVRRARFVSCRGSEGKNFAITKYGNVPQGSIGIMPPAKCCGWQRGGLKTKSRE